MIMEQDSLPSNLEERVLKRLNFSRLSGVKSILTLVSVHDLEQGLHEETGVEFEFEMFHVILVEEQQILFRLQLFGVEKIEKSFQKLMPES